MKVTSLVLGIIGGIIALIYGAVFYAAGSVGQAIGVEGSGFTKFLSIALPILALVGAGLVMSKPAIGAALMGIAALGIIITLGFGTFTFILILLLGIASVLGFLGMQEDAKAAQKQ